MSSASSINSNTNSSASGQRHRTATVTLKSARTNRTSTMNITFLSVIGKGTFGVIEKAQLQGTHAPVAVKKVYQDPRYKNRELNVMQRIGDHPNIVRFLYYYFSNNPPNNKQTATNNSRRGGRDTTADIFLNIVMEYVPESLCDVIFRLSEKSETLPLLSVRMYTYQMLRALSYLHSLEICHRDIKSSNLLVNQSSLVLKLCDFGSAKEMIAGATNVSYISSRYYRAPELLFGAQVYTCAIDIWSAGCVLAEMMRLQCLFTGSDSLDQLVKIIKVLGTPSRDDILVMNPNYAPYTNYPQVRPCPVKLYFPRNTSTDLLDLMGQMLVYRPNQRVKPLRALAHHTFDELRGPDFRLSNGLPAPPLFDFSFHELSVEPGLRTSLMPRSHDGPVPVLGNGVADETQLVSGTEDSSCEKRETSAKSVDSCDT